MSNFIFIDFWNLEVFSASQRGDFVVFDAIDVENAIYIFVYIHLFSYIFSVRPSILTPLTLKHYLYVYIHASFFDQQINSRSNSYAIDMILGCTVYIYFVVFRSIFDFIRYWRLFLISDDRLHHRFLLKPRNLSRISTLPHHLLDRFGVNVSF